MNKEKLELITGAMLQDIEKIIFRTEYKNESSESIDEYLKQKCNVNNTNILDCIKYHDIEDIKTAKLEKNNLAYITSLADDIAVATDKRKKEETIDSKRNMALQSTFSILNGNKKEGMYKPTFLNHDEGINYPIEEQINYQPDFYNQIKIGIEEKLKKFQLEERYIQSLLESLEGYLTYVPSSTQKNEMPDISLYDKIKMTTAFATCIYDYLTESGAQDYTQLLEDNKSFHKANMFYLYSMDVSGIQSFIYTVISKNALKSLRTRSFYLEILLEDIIDTILEMLELTRANVLYSGGGHCYLILPNTNKAKNELEKINQEVNNWLLDNFNIELYVAGDGQECSPETFYAENIEEYRELYKKLSRKLSNQKLNRYTEEQLYELNHKTEKQDERECKICHKVESLLNTEDGKICTTCNDIKEFSKHIIKAKVFAITKNIKGFENKKLELPFNHYIIPIDNDQKLLRELSKDNEIVRVYSKNNSYLGEGIDRKIWIGDYAYDNELNIFSQGADGIKRIAALRADVDNLGMSFIKGFEDKYTSITRTSDFSRNMSLFFKYHINHILEHGEFTLTNKQNKNRKILVVYSGGDDVFVLGAWNDVIEFAIDLKNSLKKFTLNSLTISGGIGIYSDKYPVKNIAEDTGNLESHAKDNIYYENNVEKQKNSICLFEKNLTFSWGELEEKVIGEKLELLKTYFTNIDERGKSFLYRILSYLRDTKENKLNLARLAYLLGRTEPLENDATKQELHQEFSQKIYKYAKNEKDKKQLIAAIYILIYLERR